MHFEQPIDAEWPAKPQTFLVAGISLATQINAALIMDRPQVSVVVFIVTPSHSSKSSCTNG